jgi:hypothetical protein
MHTHTHTRTSRNRPLTYTPSRGGAVISASSKLMIVNSKDSVSMGTWLFRALVCSTAVRKPASVCVFSACLVFDARIQHSTQCALFVPNTLDALKLPCTAEHTHTEHRQGLIHRRMVHATLLGSTPAALVLGQMVEGQTKHPNSLQNW